MARRGGRGRIPIRFLIPPKGNWDMHLKLMKRTMDIPKRISFLAWEGTKEMTTCVCVCATILPLSQTFTEVTESQR